MNTVPLFAARVEDLTHSDAIVVTCPDCNHKSEVKVASLKARLPDWYRVTDIPKVLRCQNCGERGYAMVNARSALGYDKID